MVKGLAEDIVRYTKCVQEERERTASRNKWISDLRQSLND